MGIRVTDVGKLLVEQHVGLGPQRVFPDRFVAQNADSLPNASTPVAAGGSAPVTLSDQVGWSVCVNGDLAVVGVPAHTFDTAGAASLTNAGAVYVYARGDNGWSYAYKIVSPTRIANDRFGTSVALYNGVLAVGSVVNTTDSANANAITGAGAVWMYDITNTAGVFKQKLTPTGANSRVANDQFGYSVAVMQDVVVVGSPYQDYDESGNNAVTDSGAAYVFIRNADTKLWSQTQKVIAQGNSRNSNDAFGSSVSSDGATLAVGVPGYDYGAVPGLAYSANAGATLVFYWDKTQGWVYEAIIIPTSRAAGEQFGFNVACYGNNIAVSSTLGDGRVRTYNRTKPGTWVETATLLPSTFSLVVNGTTYSASTSAAQFGYSLSMNKSTLVIGALNQQTPNSSNQAIRAGRAYVYVTDGVNWTLQTALDVPSQPNNLPGNAGAIQFGFSTSVTDDLVVVGAPSDNFDRNGNNSQPAAGSAFVFSRSGTTWSFLQKLTGWGQDRNTNDNLGSVLAYSNGVLAVAATTHAYDADGNNYVGAAGAVYTWTYDGTGFTFQQKITPTGLNARNLNDQFGYAVAIDNNDLAISSIAHAYDSAGANSLSAAGAVWMYRYVNGVWTQLQKLTPTGTNARGANNNFGYRLSINSGTLAAVSLNNGYDAAGANLINSAGAVFVFDYDATNNVWTQSAKVVAQGAGGRVAGDQFGFSVDYRDNTLLVGSPTHTYDFDGVNSQTGAGAAWLYARTNGTWNFVNKFSGWGQDRNTNDFFGVATSADGNTLAVGMSGHSYDANSRNFVSLAGAVIVYTLINGVWTFQAKLTAEGNRAANARFGRSLAIDGDTLVVGAPGDNVPVGGFSSGSIDSWWGNGAVYVFTRSFGVWSRQARLTPTGTNTAYNNYNRNVSPYSNERFGWSVSISGNQLIVGCPFSNFDHNGANLLDYAGAAYVFVRNASTNVWAQEARLSSALIGADRAVNDQFGWSVSIKDGIAVVGSPLQDLDQSNTNNLSSAGAAYVFRRDPNGDAGFVWNGEQKLVAWGQERVASDQLGTSVAGHNGTLAVGAPFHSYDSASTNYKLNAGAVYVWVLSNNTWLFQQKVVATGTAFARNANDQFGASVAVYGDTMVVGAPGYKYYNDNTASANTVGTAFVYTRTNGAWSLQQQLQKDLYIKTNATTYSWGEVVAINIDTIAVSDTKSNYTVAKVVGATNAGLVSVFTRANGAWSLQQNLTATALRTNERFGQSIDVRDNMLVVGSQYSATDTNDQPVGVIYTNQGGVWVFNRTGTNWSLLQKLSGAPVERVQSDQAGYQVSADGLTLAVSATNHAYDNDGSNYVASAGAVYMYQLINNSWRFESKLVAPSVARATNATFGLAISVSNDTVAIGAPGSTVDSTGANPISSAGAAFVFRATQGSNTRKTKRRAVFTALNALQQFTVPAGVTNLNVMMWGASGGGTGGTPCYGGAGGFVRALVPVTAGETLSIVAGTAGNTYTYVGSGGGRSELLRGTTTLLLAAGGGGAGTTIGASFANGGAGGGNTGEDALDQGNTGGGKGGTQTAGGLAGYTSQAFKGSNGAAKQGGNGYTPATAYSTLAGGWPNGGNATYVANSWYCAGGGDGWFGGGASSHAGPDSFNGNTAYAGGGGGGSSYIAPGIVGYTLSSDTHIAPESKRLANINGSLAAGQGTQGVGNGGTIVLEWDEIYTPRVWSQEAFLTPTGTNSRVASDQFGYSVSIKDNVLVVGAPGQDFDEAGANSVANAGAAWVFERTGTTWAQGRKLVGFGTNARGSGDQFGYSVTTYGDLIVVGAPNHATDEAGRNALITNGNGAGAAWVFRKANGTWNQLQKLVGLGRDLDGSNNTGYSTSGDGIYLAVGSPGFDYDSTSLNYIADAGAVYMWVWNGSVWTLEQRINAPDLYRTTGARFGDVVSLRDDTLIVGAPLTQIGSAGNAGAVFVFRRTNADTNAPWALEASIEPPAANVVANGKFGAAVVYYKDSIAVGATGSQTRAGVTDGVGGAAFVFARSGTTWSLQQRLVPTGTNANNSGDTFGSSLSMYDDMLVVGAPSHTYDQDGRNSQTNAGAVWVFGRSNGAWAQQQKVVAWGQDRNDSDRMGSNVAGIGTTLVTSAPNHGYDADGNNYVVNAGAIYVWVWEGNPAAWRLQQKLTPVGVNARIAGDQLGSSTSVVCTPLAVSGDLIAVGSLAHAYDAAGANPVNSAGAVWLFRRVAGPAGTKVWTQEAKITPTGTNSRNASDQFGYSVSVDDVNNTLIVGAPYHDYDDTGANAITDAGAVYYFRLENGTWNQKQKIAATGINRGVAGTNARVASDLFGWSVGVRGEIMVIGAPNHDYDQNGRNVLTNSGAVFLYSRDPVTQLWVQKQKLVGWGQDRVTNDQYGFATAGDGNFLAVGAPGQSYDGKSDYYVSGAGAVYIWSYSDGDWNYVQKLSAQDGPTNTNRLAGDQFGYSMVMVGEYLIVGAPTHDLDSTGVNSVTDAGAVFVYRRVSGLYTLVQKITPTANRGAADLFGYSMAVDGDTLVVGAPQHDFDATGANSITDAGAVWVYRLNNSTWNLEAKVTPTGTNARVAGDQFGYSVSVKNGLMVVGAPYQDYDQLGGNTITDSGAAWVFRRSGSTWNLEDKVSQTGEERRNGDNLGSSVSVWADTMVVGAPNHGYDRFNRAFLANAGAAYVFKWNGNAWTYSNKLTPIGANARNANDLFGSSVAVWNGYIVIGAPQHAYDTDGTTTVTNGGAAWVFALNNNGYWAQMAKLAAVGTNSRVASDKFGSVLAIRDNTIVVGVPQHPNDTGGANTLTGAGAAYVYSLVTQSDNSQLWQFNNKLIPTGANARNASDAFGTSVSVYGNALVVGAPGHQYPADGYAGADSTHELAVANAGAAWLFKQTDGVWTQTNKLTGIESARRTGDHFGTSVVGAADALVVGAVDHPLDSTNRNYLAGAGALFAYNRRSVARSNFVRFGGTADYADISLVNAALNNKPFTLSCWMRTTDVGANPMTLISMSQITGTSVVGKWYVGVNNGSVIVFSPSGSATFTSPSAHVSDGAWHHVAVTLDGGTGRVMVWVDGNVIGSMSTTFANVAPKNTWTVLVGALVNTSDANSNVLSVANQFNGDISDVAVWNAVVTPTDIRSIASGTANYSTISSANFYGYWIKN